MSASYDLMNKFGAITHGSSCAQSHSQSMAIGRKTRGGCLCTFWEAFHPCNSWKLVNRVWNHLISFWSVRWTFRSFWDPWSILVFSRAHNMKALLFQTFGSTLIPSSVLRETTKQSRATSINWWDPDLLVSKHVNEYIWILAINPCILYVGWGRELANWCSTMATPLTMSSLIMAKTMSHHDDHNNVPLWWPNQYPIMMAITMFHHDGHCNTTSRRP